LVLSQYPEQHCDPDVHDPSPHPASGGPPESGGGTPASQHCGAIWPQLSTQFALQPFGTQHAPQSTVRPQLSCNMPHAPLHGFTGEQQLAW